MREGAPTSHERGRGDRDVRGSIGSRRRGKKTPTLLSPRTETMRDGSRQQAKCGQLRSAEAFASVVKHSVPRKSAWSPRLLSSQEGLRKKAVSTR